MPDDVVSRGVTPEEADLVRQIEELREAVRARDAFLDTAAHELRNPMGALLMQVERTLKTARQTGNAGLIQQLERTERTVHRYVKRATTLLDVSRINAGKLRLGRETVDFAEVVREVVEAHAAEADYSGTELRVHLPDSLSMVGDRLALEQIADNLISNAIKYGAEAPVDIVLTSQNAAICMTVRDRGIGISNDNQARLFQRFERLFEDQQQGGFGIGLWLVRQLVEALGGEITVASTSGQGSTFTVTIPLDATPREPEKK